MTISYFTHVRCLGDGSQENPFFYNYEFLPEIDALLMFINNRAACVDLTNNIVSENMSKPRWFDTINIARNKHITIIYTSSEEEDFANQLASFSSQRPVRPYAETYEAYINAVSNHRIWLIDFLSNVDETFDALDIRQYIQNISFIDEDFSAIRQWMIDIIDGNNILFPTTLVNDKFWNMENFNRLYSNWTLEGPYSDINKIFKAFEIYNMNCILEVV
jgi:hypothetical protein